MRKLTAISLLLIVVFNTCGYRVMISHLQQINSVALEASIDQRHYEETELISVKLKLSLPYYNNSPQFERAYGSVNINGVEYEYVKRRVYQDRLELLCLPNHGKTKLNRVSNDIAKGATDGAASPVKKNSTLKISLPDYFHQEGEKPIFLSTEILPTYFSKQTTLMAGDYTAPKEKPPRVII